MRAELHLKTANKKEIDRCSLLHAAFRCRRSPRCATCSNHLHEKQVYLSYGYPLMGDSLFFFPRPHGSATGVARDAHPRETHETHPWRPMRQHPHGRPIGQHCKPMGDPGASTINSWAYGGSMGDPSASTMYKHKTAGDSWESMVPY